MEHTYSNEQFELLLSIAKLQQKLFSYAYDFEKREATPIPLVKEGLFGKKKRRPRELEQLEYERFLLSKQAYDMNLPKSDPDSVFWWWQLDWRELETCLLEDLVFPKRLGDWRYEYGWRTLENNGRKLLVLLEEGNCSLFAGSSRNFHDEVSPFTQQERDEMLKTYDKKANEYDLWEWLVTADSPVKSLWTGTEYESGTDYMLSFEHYAQRSSYRTAYEEKMSSNLVTHTVSASSVNSIYYGRAYAVGEYKIVDGELIYLCPYLYPVLDRIGDKEIEPQNVFNHAPMVLCAAHLATLPELKTVPLQLVKEGLVSSQRTIYGAVNDAEVLTLLADKIQI